MHDDAEEPDGSEHECEEREPGEGGGHHTPGGNTGRGRDDPAHRLRAVHRLIVIERGRIVQSGTPAEVTERPRTPYVADLVGVNLLRGRASGDGIELAGGGHLEVVGAGAGEVFAVIPPRSISLWRSRPDGSPRNVWRGRAAGLDLLGDRVRVRVDAAPQTTLVAEVTPAAVTELRLAEGSDIWVSVKATEVNVYPALVTQPVRLDRAHPLG